MEDNIRQKLKKIGRLQKKIVIWLGNKQEVTTKEQLRSRWKSYYPTRTASFEDIARSAALGLGLNTGLAKVIEQTQRGITLAPPEPTPYAPYLTDSYFEEENEEKSLLEEGWIRWNPKEIIDGEFSQAKSASFSKSIRGLEDRDLIEIAKILGKKQQISHVKLTFNGEVASVLLRQEKYKN